MSWLGESRWSPYRVGTAIGLLSWFILLVSRHRLGCSSAFARGPGCAQLGNCPGTIAAYPRLKTGAFARGDFGDMTWPRLFKVSEWRVIVPLLLLIALAFWLLERAGLQGRCGR